MITKIYLVRHTETLGNVQKRLTGREDYAVTENGEKYVELLTDRLKDIKFSNVYSSSTGRSIKTVEKIARLQGLDVKTSDDLCEMYFGIYDGMKWEEVNKMNPEIDRLHKETNEIMNIPKQEKTEEVANRMYEYIRKIARENLGKNILIGSHGVAIEAFLRRVTKLPFLEKIEEYSQKNTTVNILEYDDELDEFSLILLNDISHLKNL